MPLGQIKLRWVESEDNLIRKHYPDRQLLCRLMPHRTYAAIVRRAAVIGAARHMETWKGNQVKELKKAIARNAPLAEIYAIFPNMDRIRVLRKRLSILGTGKRPSRQYFRHPAVLSIRTRLKNKGLSLRHMSKELGMHRWFGRTEKNTGIMNIIKAVHYLGGEIDIVWSEQEG